MSSRAKAFFGFSVTATAGIVYGVHYLQVRERENMYQGVIKDEARIAQKKQQRAREMEEQQMRRSYLESVQPVSSDSGAPSNGRGQQPVTLEQLKHRNISFDGCQTCKD